MSDQMTHLPESVAGPSLQPTPTPVIDSRNLEGVQLAMATVSTQPVSGTMAEELKGIINPEVKSANAGEYNVVVRAPGGKGMLAYLVGPGAVVVMKDIDLNKATLTEEGGNLRISLPDGGEILLLDFVASSQSAQGVTVQTEAGTLPAQTLLAALDVDSKDIAKVEPAAGESSVRADGIGNSGFEVPTVEGNVFGVANPILSEVIGPFALPIKRDEIIHRDFPVEGHVAPLAPPPVPGNQPPVAHVDNFSTAENVAIVMTPAQLLANDSDPEGDRLTIISVQGAEHGTVTLNPDGTVTFTPTNGFTGTGSYSYTISDGNGGTSTADVYIQIDPDPSNENNVIAADDAYTVAEAGRSIVMDVLRNDSDPEGDAILPGSVRIISGPDKGTATVNPDGTINYVSVGRDGYFTSLVYEITDARGARDTATVVIEVKPAVNSVEAIDDTGEIIPAGASKAFNVVANDLDPQGDDFKITRIVSGPAVGTASFDPATGVIVYNSVPSNSGYDVKIVYEITDSRGATDTATLTVRVEPSNNVSAVDDTADVTAGQDVRIAVLANDFDAQGDTFSVTRIVEQPRLDDGTLRGTVVINTDGTITYTDTPGARDSAVVEFKYEIVDSRGAVDIAVVRVTIGTAPNGVDANNDTLTVLENSVRTDITDRLLANDFDPQNDTFSITAITSIPASQGTLELVGDRVFFTPALNYDGPVHFTYTITDSKGATDTAQVTINVLDNNLGLNAGNDYFSTPFNTDLSITPSQLLSNDNDPDGDVLGSANIISYTNPTNGTLVRNADGTFTYNPNDTFRGVDTFTYTIRDSQGQEDTATVTIRVADPQPLDNPVDAVDDVVNVRPGETKQVNVLTNDSAPDGGLAFVRIIGTLPAGVTQISPGVFSYTAPLGTGGTNVSFQYEARDIDGDTDIATVTFNVLPNDVDARDDVVTMPADVNSILIDAKANDVDPQGDTFNITRIVSVSEGTATIENGQIRYDNPSRLSGTATIVYEITDSRGATDTATITVNIVADFNNVIANDDVVNMPADVNSILIDAKANDSDPQGDVFNITRIVSVSEGTATIENGQIRYDNPTRLGGTATIVYEVTDALGATDTATITVNIVADFNNVIARDDVATMPADVNSILIDAKANDSDPQGDAFSITRIVSVSSGTATIENGQVRYDNPTRDAGTATIVYEITDALGATSQATITVNIIADTNSVDARDDVASVTAGQAVNINVAANDVDPQGDTFVVTRIVSQPATGSAVLNADGTVTYTSVGRDAYTATFTYEIRDSRGATDIATVTVNVAAAPNNVVAVDDTVTLPADQRSILVNVIANDYDPQGDAFSVTRIVSGPSVGTATIENGQIRYDDGGYRGSGTVSVVYEITDSRGAVSQATLYVNIVADFNSVVAVNDTVNLPADQRSILVNVIANDYDPQGDAFSVTRIVSGPSVGTATIENGQIRYDDGGFRDSGTVAIVYEITDALGATSQATLYVNIATDSNNVVAQNDWNQVTAGQAVWTNVVANDYDPQGDSFTIIGIVGGPGAGSAYVSGGHIVYQSVGRDAYTDYITYRIQDSRGAISDAVLTIQVNTAYNDVVAQNDWNQVTAGQGVWTNVLANDYDPQGDGFSIIGIIGGPGAGSAYVSGGHIVYQSVGRDAYTDYITYRIQDSRGAISDAVLTINVGAAPNNVVAQDDHYQVPFGSWIAINPTGNDYDPQGDAFSISSFANGGQGTYGYILNWFGQYYYVPYGFENVTDAISYTITDSRGAISHATMYFYNGANTNTGGGGDNGGGGGGGDGGGGDTPLAIDFGKEGFHITNQDGSSAYFDWNNDGTRTKTGWFSSEDGILARDVNGDGKIDNGSEVFGNYNHEDGFAALAKLDSNGDGKIDANDAGWNELKLWFDLNGDGVGTADELKTLDEMGVKAIHLNAAAVNTKLNGGYIPLISGVEMKDGTVKIIADVVFKNDSTKAVAHQDTANTAETQTVLADTARAPNEHEAPIARGPNEPEAPIARGPSDLEAPVMRAPNEHEAPIARGPNEPEAPIARGPSDLEAPVMRAPNEHEAPIARGPNEPEAPIARGPSDLEAPVMRAPNEHEAPIARGPNEPEAPIARGPSDLEAPVMRAPNEHEAPIARGPNEPEAPIARGPSDLEAPVMRAPNEHEAPIARGPNEPEAPIARGPEHDMPSLSDVLGISAPNGIHLPGGHQGDDVAAPTSSSDSSHQNMGATVSLNDLGIHVQQIDPTQHA